MRESNTGRGDLLIYPNQYTTNDFDKNKHNMIIYSCLHHTNLVDTHNSVNSFITPG